MKTGMSLVEMAQELQRQQATKLDMMVPTTAITLVTEGTTAPSIVVPGHGEYPATPHTQSQLAERLGIPYKYWQRMATEQPALLASNANTWLHAKNETRLLRTLDGKARAFLSDRYAIYDADALAELVIPVLSEAGVTIESCNISDSKFYLKFRSPRNRAQVRVGDYVEAGGTISTSEIGLGAREFWPFIFRLSCTNGMTVQEYGDKKYHLGAKNDGDGEQAKILSAETRTALQKADYLRIRDIVKAFTEGEQFQKIVNNLKDLTDLQLDGQPEAIVQVVANRFDLSDNERGSVLQHLLMGRDLTGYGLVNAITRTAEDSLSYDRASELEALGGKVMTLPKTDWKFIASSNDGKIVSTPSLN